MKYTVYTLEKKQFFGNAFPVIENMERKDAIQVFILLNEVQQNKQSSIFFVLNFHADELKKNEKEEAKLSVQKLLTQELLKISSFQNFLNKIVL